MGVIYMATCRTSRKRYVGQTIQTFNNRKIAHKTQAFNQRLQEKKGAFHRAIIKYGWDDFDWEVLFEVNDILLNDYEAKAIEFYGTLCPRGYNIMAQSDSTPGQSVTLLRKREADRDLPRRVYAFSGICRERVRSGYRVVLADGRTKEFAASRESDAIKRAKAIAWWERARGNPSIGRGREGGRERKLAHSEGLPTGVYPVTSQTGELRGYKYQVRVGDKIAKKRFTQAVSLEDNLAMCLSERAAAAAS